MLLKTLAHIAALLFAFACYSGCMLATVTYYIELAPIALVVIGVATIAQLVLAVGDIVYNF